MAISTSFILQLKLWCISSKTHNSYWVLARTLIQTVSGLLTDAVQVPAVRLHPLGPPAGFQHRQYTSTDCRHALTRHARFVQHRSLFCTELWLRLRHTCERTLPHPDACSLFTPSGFLLEVTMTCQSFRPSLSKKTETWKGLCVCVKMMMLLKIKKFQKFQFTLFAVLDGRLGCRLVASKKRSYLLFFSSCCCNIKKTTCLYSPKLLPSVWNCWESIKPYLSGQSLCQAGKEELYVHIRHYDIIVSKELCSFGPLRMSVLFRQKG